MVKALYDLYLELLYYIRGPRQFEDGEIVRIAESGEYSKVINYNKRSNSYYIISTWMKRKEIIKLSEDEKIAHKIITS